MKTRKPCKLWTAKNLAIAGLLTLATSMALMGCPWFTWSPVCNLASLLLLDVI